MARHLMPPSPTFPDQRVAERVPHVSRETNAGRDERPSKKFSVPAQVLSLSSLPNRHWAGRKRSTPHTRFGGLGSDDSWQSPPPLGGPSQDWWKLCDESTGHVENPVDPPVDKGVNNLTAGEGGTLVGRRLIVSKCLLQRSVSRTNLPTRHPLPAWSTASIVGILRALTALEGADGPCWGLRLVFSCRHAV